MLDNGIEVTIGKQEARLRLQRPRGCCRSCWRAAHRCYADLRYTNGFALEWGEPGPAGGDAGGGGALASLTRHDAPTGLRSPLVNPGSRT